MLGWLILVLLALGAAFWALSGNPEALAQFSTGELLAGAVGLTLIALYLISLSREGAESPLRAISYLGIWALAGAGLVLAYSYRDDLAPIAQRITSELALPGQPVSVDPGVSGRTAVRLRRRWDGHYAARANVNGVPLSLMVDTGASTVVLKPADAERAGIDTSKLSFTVPVETANGTAYAAPARIRSIVIGSIKIEGVEALVAKPGAVKESLLGMSFLRRLRSYEFSGEFLTLRT